MTTTDPAIFPGGTTVAVLTESPLPLPATVNVIVPKAHLASLDGLRGLACLMVVAFHCHYQSGEIPWPTITIGGHLIPLHLTFSYGTVGVDIFFVLSGFCLTYPLFQRPDKAVDWWRYFKRRCIRILPPYWAVLVLLTLIHLVIEKLKIAPFAGNFLTLPSFRQLLYTFAMISAAYNESFWTLPIEWKWYFTMPLLFLVWRQFGAVAGWALTAVVCAASAGLYWPGNERAFFLVGLLPTLVPIFAAGVYAADLCSRKILSPLERRILDWAPWGLILGIILLATVPLGQEHPYRDFLTRALSRLPLSFFAVLVAVRHPFFRPLLSNPILGTIGLFSYSLYLIHTPIIVAVKLVVERFHLSPPVHTLLFQGPVFLLCIVAGYAFYLLAEKPFLRVRAQSAAGESGPR